MRSLSKEYLKTNRFFKRALETIGEPLRPIQSLADPSESKFTNSILTYEERRELKLAIAKYEAQKAEIIERLRLSIL